MTGCVRSMMTGLGPESDQHARSTVGMTGRIRSGRFSVRSVAELSEFDPNGYFLSGAYKYNPNRPFEECGAEETYQGCRYTILVISTCIVLSDSLGD